MEETQSCLYPSLRAETVCEITYIPLLALPRPRPFRDAHHPRPLRHPATFQLPLWSLVVLLQTQVSSFQDLSPLAVWSEWGQGLESEQACLNQPLWLPSTAGRIPSGPLSLTQLTAA